MIDLQQGDCLELMKQIPDESIDLILCDLPYGITNHKWDVIIPFDQMWEQYDRIIKEHGAIVLFGAEPFSSQLRVSNLKEYRYDWIWCKNRATLFQSSHRRPMNKHETVSVFYKHQPTYNPQMEKGTPYKNKGGRMRQSSGFLRSGMKSISSSNDGTRFPTTLLKFSNSNHARLHPTQKPVSILEYLIETYTNKGDLVLDNCMGSGSTGEACLNTGRSFIGYEMDSHYFKVAKERLQK